MSYRNVEFALKSYENKESVLSNKPASGNQKLEEWEGLAFQVIDPKENPNSPGAGGRRPKLYSEEFKYQETEFRIEK